MEQVYLPAVILRPSGCHKKMFVGGRGFPLSQRSFLLFLENPGEILQSAKHYNYSVIQVVVFNRWRSDQAFLQLLKPARDFLQLRCVSLCVCLLTTQLKKNLTNQLHFFSLEPRDEVILFLEKSPRSKGGPEGRGGGEFWPNDKGQGKNFQVHISPKW